MSRLLQQAMLIIGFMCVMAGCQKLESEKAVEAAAAPPTPGEVTTAPEPPRMHVWRYLAGYGTEPEGYATYSYVLAGRTHTDAAQAQRYDALINAIQASTAEAGSVPQDLPKNLMNLFLLPASPTAGNASGAAALSLALLTVLSAADARFQNPGPFIVTLYHPISFTGEPRAELLFVDLTNTHPQAMAELVAIYKRRISDAPIEGVERLKSLRLSLLNTLLVADDRIGFATAAYADMKAAFEPK